MSPLIPPGEEVEVTSETLPLLRELAEARLVLVINTYAGGPESAWRSTYWGWKRKPEWVEMACAKASQWTMENQMFTAASETLQIGHWAYMLQTRAGKPSWYSLLGSGESVPAFLSQ